MVDAQDLRRGEGIGVGRFAGFFSLGYLLVVATFAAAWCAHWVGGWVICVSPGWLVKDPDPHRHYLGTIDGGVLPVVFTFIWFAVLLAGGLLTIWCLATGLSSDRRR